MSPQLRRFLPMILIVLLLVTFLPALLGKRSTSGTSASERSRRTLEAVRLIDRGEQRYRAAHGRYTGNLADLMAGQPRLADDLTIGLSVHLDVASDGKSYLAQVVGDVLSLVRFRNDSGVRDRCLVLRSGSGIECPPGSEATPVPTTATTATTTGG
jgi:type II secretory pathway pseudopilin PulG